MEHMMRSQMYQWKIMSENTMELMTFIGTKLAALVCNIRDWKCSQLKGQGHLPVILQTLSLNSPENINIM
jgi:hypothetical protein